MRWIAGPYLGWTWALLKSFWRLGACHEAHSMGQGLYYDLVSLIMSSWGYDMTLDMVVGQILWAMVHIRSDLR